MLAKSRKLIALAKSILFILSAGKSNIYIYIVDIKRGLFLSNFGNDLFVADRYDPTMDGLD